MQKFTKELIIAFTLGIAVIVSSNLAFAQQNQGVEWRNKPVQCGPENEFWPVLNRHGEKPLMGAIAKLEGPGEPTTHWPIAVYVNTETGTFTIAEFHLGRGEVCVIGYGNAVDFDVEKYFNKKSDT
tara:strand:+ start:168 stop:545 length:378 start_codon:yes stop_codon:yes gene_type:complete